MHEIQTTVNLKFVNMPWRLGKKPLDHFLPSRRRDSPRRQYREAASVSEHLRELVQRGPLKNVVNVRYHQVLKGSSRLEDRKSSRLEGCTSGPSFSAANQGEIRDRFWKHKKRYWRALGKLSISSAHDPEAARTMIRTIGRLGCFVTYLCLVGTRWGPISFPV